MSASRTYVRFVPLLAAMLSTTAVHADADANISGAGSGAVMAEVLGEAEAKAAGDLVERVYLCGHDVGIKMKNSGWVVAQESRMDAKRVDRFLAVALTLLASQREASFFNVAETINWCGIPETKAITILQTGNSIGQ